MQAHRLRSEIIAWASGAALGTAVGVILGAWSAPIVGVFSGAAVGLLVALSVRRERGAQGWSDIDGESHGGEGTSSPGAARAFVKGTRSAADFPVAPGMGAIGRGPNGTGS